MTISKFRALEKKVAASSLAKKINLLAISLDPEFDVPTRTKDYFENRGSYINDFVKILTGEKEVIFQLFQSLDVGVTHFNENVILHGIELLLFDKKGRLVRKYQNTHWDENMVFSDLKKLREERL